MMQELSPQEERFIALQESYNKACGMVKTLAQEAVRYGLWEKDGLGQQLYDLYLRLKRGPVRAVIMGETSSGKSTLINALVGSVIVPESADACSPVPIWFTGDGTMKEPNITYFPKPENELPEESFANHTALLQWHHTAEALAQDADIEPFVHTCSHTFPRFVTLVDTPGLNANAIDTQKMYALFDRPSYATEDEPDLPELVLYVSIAGGNLSEAEMSSLRCLLEKGVDPHRIFIVDNEICSNVSGLPLARFEQTEANARNGLAESYKKLLPVQIPDFSAMIPDDPSAFFAVAADECSTDVPVLSEKDVQSHIVSLNALFARVFYAGKYNYMNNLINGATRKQFEALKLAAKGEKQDQVLRLCNEWRDDHTDYQPLLDLRDKVNEQALNLMETADLKSAFRAVNRLGEKLRASRIQQLTEAAEQNRKPIQARTEELYDLRIWMKTFHDKQPQKIDGWQKECILSLKQRLQEIKKKQDRSIDELLEEIAKESKIKTAGDRFLQGAQQGSTLGEKLALGLMYSAFSTRNWLESRFESLLEQNPCHNLSNDAVERDQQLIRARQKPESEPGVFTTLDYICKKLLYLFNAEQLKPDEEGIADVRQLIEKYYFSLPAMLQKNAEEIHTRLSVFCQTLKKDTDGENGQQIDEVLERWFSSETAAQFGEKLRKEHMEWILPCCGAVVSTLREAMANPIQQANTIAQQIQARYQQMDVSRINQRNVRKLVFQQVICPILTQETGNARGKLNTAKALEQMGKLMDAAAAYASQSMEPVFQSGCKVLEQCGIVLQQTVTQWRKPEDEEEVKALEKKLAEFQKSFLETAEGSF